MGWLRPSIVPLTLWMLACDQAPAPVPLPPPAPLKDASVERDGAQPADGAVRFDASLPVSPLDAGADAGAEAGLDGGPGADAGPEPIPTYAADVQPLFRRHCALCHESIPGLPAVLEYPVALELRLEIQDAVETRSMPPCEGMADPCGLTPAQIETVSAWVRGGAPER